jgi:hypothetical protein
MVTVSRDMVTVSQDMLTGSQDLIMPCYKTCTMSSEMLSMSLTTFTTSRVNYEHVKHAWEHLNMF